MIPVMTEDQIKQSLDTLRTNFFGFMEAMNNISGSTWQKQQAFLRFEEGHMWMQNAILRCSEVAEEAKNA